METTLFKKYKQVWETPNTFASTALVLFVDRYGSQAISWEPETIEMEIEEDFLVNIHPAVYDRLMASISLLRDNSFFARLPDFMYICSIFSGNRVSKNTVPVLDVDDVAWGLTEALLLVNLDDGTDIKKEFDPEIIGFLENLLNYYSFISVPDALKRFVDPQKLKFIQPGFESDPVMFASMYQTALLPVDTVNQITKRRLLGLFKQLSDLPLRTQSAKQKIVSVSKKIEQLEQLKGLTPLELNFS